MPHPENLQFDNTYAQLSPAFFTRAKPTPYSHHYIVSFNQAVADLLGIDRNAAGHAWFLEVFSGKTQLPGMQPLAAVYAGHQFGVLVPQLGDGRAILLGELKTQNNTRWDLQLKGAGQTAYSRQGDGRAVLRSTIREYLCGEAMHALGIPTTRSLCIIGSDDEVYREAIEQGAILTRVAPSHIRFGSFEYFFYSGREDALRELADYVITHHYPQFENIPEKYSRLLEEVIKRTAALIAHWQAVGFAHGVMNSDNMSILGLTLDFGPFGFLDTYDPGYICNHSDHQGRYAFNKQPDIGLFNLSCLAQAMLPLLADEPEHAAQIARHYLKQYETEFVREYAAHARAKLGLVEQRAPDQALFTDLLQLMTQDRVDYTRLFRALCNFQPGEPNNEVRDFFIHRPAFDQWAQRYAQRLALEAGDHQKRRQRMRLSNPKFILRSYLAEIAIQKAQQKDYSEIDLLLNILQNPFAEQPRYQNYAAEPPDWAEHISVSCSS